MTAKTGEKKSTKTPLIYLPWGHQVGHTAQSNPLLEYQDL